MSLVYVSFKIWQQDTNDLWLSGIHKGQMNGEILNSLESLPQNVAAAMN